MNDVPLYSFHCPKCSHVWVSSARRACPECVRTMRESPQSTPLQPVQFAWDAIKAQRCAERQASLPMLTHGLDQAWIAQDGVADNISKMFKDSPAEITRRMIESQMQARIAKLPRPTTPRPEDNRVDAARMTMEWHIARMQDQALGRSKYPDPSEFPYRSSTNAASSYEMTERMKDMQREIDRQRMAIATLEKSNQKLQAENQEYADAIAALRLKLQPKPQPTPAPAPQDPLFRAIAVRDKQRIGVWLP